MKYILAVLIFSVFCTPAAWAKKLVGSAVIEGKVIELYDDRTWAFKNSENTECILIGQGVEFCDPQRRWTRLGIVLPPHLAAQFRFDAKN
jgi:hypothetical protein